MVKRAGVAKLVDAADLKSASFWSAGSTPAARTKARLSLRLSLRWPARLLAGVSSDEGAGDEWPGVRAKILAADILLMANPFAD